MVEKGWDVCGSVSRFSTRDEEEEGKAMSARL
jgi:hypothetical protein